MIRTFIDPKTGDKCMVDSETAFGPVFGVNEDPMEFIEWFNREHAGMRPQKCNDILLGSLIDDWRQEIQNDNEAKAERVYSDTEATTLDEQCEKARKLK